MLSARAAFKVNKIKKSSFLVFPKVVFEDGTTSCIISNRFNELLWVDEIDGALLQCETKRQLLSLQTKYACYLVYQINDNYESNFQRPVSVRDRYVGSKDWDKSEYWHIYLVRPQTPVIRPKVGENTHNPLSRPKIKGLPQQRSDSWMEVQVYEFQTTDTTEGVIPSLEVQLKLCVDSLGSLHLHILGVEFRPISIY
uniref:F-box protein At2g02240-like n=1 Tax=Erigeron canadensis TaxID=72917 RepID=UPI001CB8CFA1|nr:F-box protein At2g02240-like [Erigeron canadensis]